MAAGFFSVAGYAREEIGGSAARGSRGSGVHQWGLSLAWYRWKTLSRLGVWTLDAGRGWTKAALRFLAGLGTGGARTNTG
jgi:hypothetical protein